MKNRIAALLFGSTLALAANGGALAQDKTIKIGVKPGLVGQRADLDGLVLRERKRAGCQGQRGTEQQRGDLMLHF